MDQKERLKNQIVEAAGNVIYTYAAHWIIVNRLKNIDFWLKISQIVLTTLTTTGIITIIFSKLLWINWINAFLSGSTLFLNFYLYKFNNSEEIQQHKDAANELWEIREAYKSLVVDFDDLDIEVIRNKRDLLIEKISQINKSYPGTDEKSFTKAQKEIGKYTFVDKEAQRLINIH